jgi:stage III sporulation protein AA
MNLNSIFVYLPERLSKALISLPVSHVTEIRMRADSPVSVTCSAGNVAFDEKGNVTSPKYGLKLTKDEIHQCVNALCRHSEYSFEEYIKNGFIPLEGGGRAGVCGRAVCEKGAFKGFSEITSINVRLNLFLPEVAKASALLMKKAPCGIAVFSPPGVGKTTYLKSLIRLLSMGKYTPAYRIGIADERFELSEGISQMGICDVISGASKSLAIELFTRTMSSQIIVCDEIFSDDSQAILAGCNAGVCFVCSFHGGSLAEVLKREYVSHIFSRGIFDYAVGIEKEGWEYKYKITPIQGGMG